MKPGGIMRLTDFSQNNMYDFDRFSTQPVAAQEHVLAMSTHSHLLLTHVGGVLDVSSASSSVDNSSSDASTGNTTFEQPVISRVAIEYKDKHEDDRINTIAWITTQVIACGFESGLVQGYGENGDRLFQFVGPEETCVSAIKTTIEGPGEEILWILFENGILLAVPLSQALENNFTEAFMFSMSKFIQQANDFTLTNYVETAAQSFAMFDPLQQTSQPAPETTLPFQSSRSKSSSSNSNNNSSNLHNQESLNGSYSWSPTMKRLIVIGGQATMSLFHLDYYSILTQERKRWKQEAQSSSASSLSAASLTKSFFSMVSSFTAASSQTSTNSSSSFYGTEEESLDTSITNNFTYFFSNSTSSSNSGNAASKRRQFRELTRVTALLTDDKRRMIRLSVDPLGALCACADGLGRVTLYDLVHIYQGNSHLNMVNNSTQVLSPDDNMSQQPVLLPLRLWKGVRDAHFGWIIEEDNQSLPKDSHNRNSVNKHMNSSTYYQTHSSNSRHHSNQTIQLRLAIFAPQLGLVSIYQMRNGPCVRVIPVGFNVKMLRVPHPIFQESRNALETVLVLRSDSHTHSIEVVSLASTSQSETQLAMLVDLIMDEDKNKSSTHGKEIVSPRRQHLFPPEMWSLSDDLQDIYGLSSPSANEDTTGGNSDDYFHGDIQSSIQEAWKGLQKQQQLQQNGINNNLKQTKTTISVPEIALPWQLSRLLRMFYVHCFHQNNYNYPQFTENPNVVSYTSKLEAEMVKLFARATSVSLYVTLLRILDVVETLQFIMYHAYVPHVHYIFDPAVNAQVYEEKNMKDLEENLCLLLDPMYMRQHHQHLSSNSSGNVNPEESNSFVYAIPSLWHHHKNIVLKFSVSFQRELLQGLEALLNKITPPSESLPDQSHTSLMRDVQDRRQLLDAYQSLSTLRRQLTVDNCFASCCNQQQQNAQNGVLLPSTIQEEAAVICRQQTPRAEALCWTMRAYKLSTTQLHETLANNANNPNNSNNNATRSVSASPLLPQSQLIQHTQHPNQNTTTHNRSLSSVSPPPSSLLLSPISPTRANSTANGHNSASTVSMEGNNRYKHRMLALRETMQMQQLRRTNSNASMSPSMSSSNLTSPVHRQVSTTDTAASGASNTGNNGNENSLSLVEQEDPVNIPFAVFVQCFGYVEIQTTSQERRLLTHLLAPVCDTSNKDTKRRLKELVLLGSSCLSDITGGSSFYLDIDQWTRQRLRLLLCLPLLSDMTSLHALTSILKKLDQRFTGPLSLSLLLPMCLQVVREQSPSVLVADLLVKKNNTSPLQRWLRDHLLTFQVAMTEYRANKNEIASASVSSNSELAKEPYSGLECTDILSVCHRLTGILQPSLANNTNQGVISFGEYVLHLFAPVLHALGHSAQLEHNMSFLSLTMETLQAVNDQIERRTYGDEHVHRVMQECDTLFRQTRVLLLLKSRVVHGYPTSTEMLDDSIPWDYVRNKESTDISQEQAQRQEEEYLDWNLSASQYTAAVFTIHHLETAHVSISRILAQDSLEFGYRVAQAMEHEERCRDVFLHTIVQQHKQELLLQQQQQQQQQEPPRLSDEFLSNANNTSSSSSSSSSSTTSEALLAWGKSADKRWRDLLSLALTEDAIYATHATSTPANDTSLKHTPSTTSPLPASSSSTSSNPTNAPSTSNNNTHLKRKRKPLLLYFPYHNHPILLGSFRALWTAAQWAQHPQKIDMLVVVCEHLFEIEKPWRGLVAYEIYMRYLFPVYQGLVCLEEENTGILRPKPTNHQPTSHTGPSPGRKSPMNMHSAAAPGHSSNRNSPYVSAATRKHMPHLGRANSSSNAEMGNDGLLRVEPMRAQQLMLLMKDPALVKSLVTLTVEMLTYILETFSRLSSAAANDGGVSVTQLPLSETARTLLSLAESTQSTNNNNSNNNNNNSVLATILSNWQTCWPPVTDFTLDHLPKRFLSLLLPLHCRDVVHYHICVAYTLCLRFQCALRGVSPSLLLGRRLSVTQYEKVKRLVTHPTSSETVPHQVSLDDINDDVNVDDNVNDDESGYVELLHEVWLSTAPTTPQSLSLQSHVIRHYLLHNDTSHVPRATVQARGQFLLLSFRRMMALLHQPVSSSSSSSPHPSVTAEVRPQILYHLGKLWGFPLDAIRLLHVQVLLEQGESVQNEVENMVLSQFDDVTVVMDALLSFARQHLGALLRTIETLPQYGPVLAAMDAEALLWAKQATYHSSSSSGYQVVSPTATAVSDKLPATHTTPKISTTNNNNNNSGSSPKKVHHMLSLSNMSQLQGSFKQQLNKSFTNNNNNINNNNNNNINNNINSNVQRTAVDIAVVRRVVLYLQTLLLNVPLKDRQTTANTRDTVPPYAHWAEKYLPVSQSVSQSVSQHHHGSSVGVSSGVSGGVPGGGGGVSILHMTVYHTWLERKARCDALLSLCNAIVTATVRLQQQIQNSQQTNNNNNNNNSKLLKPSGFNK